jgi:adenylate cyclase
MTYRFGDFELRRERYELRRGAAPVPLEPRVFEVLAYLVHLTDREMLALHNRLRAEAGAYDYYLGARQLCGRPSGRTLEAARQMYLRAVDADPDYAPAHAGLSETCAALHLYWRRRDDELATADTASYRAVRLAPDLAEAHAARGQALALMRKADAAEESFQTAVRLKPRLAKTHYSYGRFCAVAGRAGVAARHFSTAEALSAGDCHYPLHAAMIYARQKRADDARAARRRGVARAEAQVGSEPADPRPWYLGAGALVALGEAERALEWAERALTLDPDDSMSLFYAGEAYAAAGRVPRALEYLDAAVRAGFRHLAWVDVVPGFASVRRDTRLRQLVRAARGARPRVRSRSA